METALVEWAMARFEKEVWHGGLSTEVRGKQSMLRMDILFPDISLRVERHGQMRRHYIMTVYEKLGADDGSVLIVNSNETASNPDGGLYWRKEDLLSEEQFKKLVDRLCDVWPEYQKRFCN